jgi:DnaA family protein
MTATQLTLSISLRDDATFANYYSLENLALTEELQSMVQGQGEQSLILWGPAATGKTHLLQAVCHGAEQAGRTSCYLPLADHLFLSPEFCDDLEHMDILCIDDLHAIAGDRTWEEALFHLFNRTRALGHRLVFAANKNVAELGIQLPDLRSRLSWGLNYHLKTLTEEEKLAALKLRASNRGMTLPLDVAQFILNHYSRDMGRLFAALDTLDRVSLAEHRKITIPFVKMVLRLTARS